MPRSWSSIRRPLTSMNRWGRWAPSPALHRGHCTSSYVPVSPSPVCHRPHHPLPPSLSLHSGWPGGRQAADLEERGRHRLLCSCSLPCLCPLTCRPPIRPNAILGTLGSPRTPGCVATPTPHHALILSHSHTSYQLPGAGLWPPCPLWSQVRRASPGEQTQLPDGPQEPGSDPGPWLPIMSSQ